MFACKNKDENIRSKSTSGGVFTAIAEFVLSKGGVIYGVIFNNEWNVTYIRAIHPSQLSHMRGSKYPQAHIGDTYILIREDLKCGKDVLFIGTPCQIRGLKAFLQIDYDKLLCVDFVCFGVASPGVWRSYLEENFKNEKINKINFKEKRNGWHRFLTVVETDSREVATLGIQNPYLGSYLTYYNVRPSCYNCKFKGIQGRNSDITISDSWGIDQVAPDFDDDKGISNIFVNTEKGFEIFEKIRDKLEFMEINLEQAICKNRHYRYSVILPLDRDKFWNIYRKKGLKRAVRFAFRKVKITNCLAKVKNIYCI